MDWLKRNYERAILGFVAIAALVCCGLIVSNVLSFSGQFAGRNSSKPHDNVIRPYPVDAITEVMAKIKVPRIWGVHDGSLFISRPYVLKDGVLIDPLEGSVDLHPPIKNSWLIKYELPYWESDVKDQDPDEDHFSNLEEFLAGTDPRDKNSVPPYYTKLRLLKFISKPFRLIFTGTPDDGQTFTINTRDRGGRTRFVQKGEMIEGTPYKVIGFQKKSVTKDEMEVDVSELEIENTETKQKLTLTVNKEANDPTSFGEFLYLYDNSKFTVKKDDSFSLIPQAEKKYKLIDISEKEAVIEDETGQKITISPAQ